jgi:hypothetical protein
MNALRVQLPAAALVVVSLLAGVCVRVCVSLCVCAGVCPFTSSLRCAIEYEILIDWSPKEGGLQPPTPIHNDTDTLARGRQ